MSKYSFQISKIEVRSLLSFFQFAAILHWKTPDSKPNYLDAKF